MFKFWFIVAFIAMLVIGSTAAQDQVVPEPQMVQVDATDGLKLVGERAKIA